MSVRSVRFAPMRLDGNGPPSIVSGAKYTICPTSTYVDTDTGGRVEPIAFEVVIADAAVTVDLPSTPLDGKWDLRVTSLLPDAAGFRHRVEVVEVPAGDTVVDYEDLPRANGGTA